MLLRTSLALCLLAPAALANDLWVGPPGSGAAFEEIQAALDAAAPGDRVLVLPGTYEESVHVEKPVELIGSGPDQTLIQKFSTTFPFGGQSPLVVSGLGAGTRVAIRGFAVATPAGVINQQPISSVCAVFDCAGLVELADLLVTAGGVPRPPQGSLGGALSLTDVAQATLTRVRTFGSAGSIVPGGSGLGDGRDGMDGLGVLRSKVAAVDCEFVGGPGGADFSGQGGQGGAGLRATDSTVWLARTRTSGAPSGGTTVALAGQGGAGLELQSSSASVHGGDGALLRGADAREQLFLFTWLISSGGNAALVDGTSALELAPDVALQPGAPTTNMPAGQMIAAAPGAAVIQWTERAPSLSFQPGLATLGANTTIEYRGEPGSVHLRALALSTATGLALPGIGGELQLNPALFVLAAAVVLDGNGAFDLPVPLPAVPALAGFSIAEQSLQVTGSELRFAPPVLLSLDL